jgi:hypothetical protein
MVTNEVLKFLMSVPHDRLSVLLNTIHPSVRNKKGITQQLSFMYHLGPVVMAGVNIFRLKLDLDYLLGYIIKYNLKKEVRLGIAHPVLSKNNISLHPKDYYKAGYEIAMFKLKIKRYGIVLGFDCGFVPCMFPHEYLRLLDKELKKVGTCCHPVIDMLADGSFIACYPLNNLLKVKIRDDHYAKALISDFENVLLPYKGIGIFPHCTSCQLFQNRCNGGCMSQRIHRYQKCD